ncbi:MAG: guanylate kinase [Nitrospiria bacterium]
MDNKGILFVVSAPSGTGKTSLCRDVTENVQNLQYSISYTTRPPRAGETDGKDYFFVDEATFQERIEKNDFIEYAKVHGHHYGTSREALMGWIDRGIDVMLDIDTQGAMILKKKFGEGVFIYILPPSFDVLRQRLIDRGSDSLEEVSRRLQKAREEIWNYRQYYYLIVNVNYTEALKKLEAVVIAERIKMKQMNLAWIEKTFIKRMSQKQQ